MGLLSGLRPGIRTADLRAAAAAIPTPGPAAPLALASPWQPTNHLAGIVWSDIFGSKLVPTTRAEAMAVPAAARARHVICSTVARIPMRAYRGGERLDPGPSWLSSTKGELSPWHRMVWTVDDLIWSGWSCWGRVNGVDGKPVAMDRIPPTRWAFGTDAENRTVVTVDNVPVPSSSVCLIPGPHEGLLTFARDTIRHAADLQRAAGRAAKHPAAYMALKQTGGTPLPKSSEDKGVVTIDYLMDQWAGAREGENGGVAYLPENLDAKEMGTFDKHLLVEGRNAAAIDVARAASLPADLVDAAAEGSMTYSNTRDNDRRALDYGVGFYLGSIDARLSQDDIVAAGTTVRFDVQDWLEQTVPGQAVAPQQQQPPVQPAQPQLRPVQEVRTA